MKNIPSHNWERVLDKDAPWALEEWTLDFCRWMKNGCGFSPNFLLDVGVGVANSEAWIFDKVFEDIKIVGFEPQGDRYNFLKEIYPGELHNLALVSRPGNVEGLMGHPDGATDFVLDARDENDPKIRNRKVVNCESVDSIISKNNMSKVFLWADIEGSEFEMLKGAIASMMKGKITAMSLEINLATNAKMIANFLSRFHYYPVTTTAYNFLGYHPDHPKEKIVSKIMIRDSEYCDILFFHLPQLYGKIPHGFLEIIDER